MRLMVDAAVLVCHTPIVDGSDPDMVLEAFVRDNLADFLHQAGDEAAAMEELKEAAALFADVGINPGELEPEVWLLKQW